MIRAVYMWRSEGSGEEGGLGRSEKAVMGEPDF